jgi:hypothetical protein
MMIHPHNAESGTMAMMTSCHTDRAEFMSDMGR